MEKFFFLTPRKKKCFKFAKKKKKIKKNKNKINEKIISYNRVGISLIKIYIIIESYLTVLTNY